MARAFLPTRLSHPQVHLREITSIPDSRSLVATVRRAPTVATKTPVTWKTWWLLCPQRSAKLLLETRHDPLAEIGELRFCEGLLRALEPHAIEIDRFAVTSATVARGVGNQKPRCWFPRLRGWGIDLPLGWPCMRAFTIPISPGPAGPR